MASTFPENLSEDSQEKFDENYLDFLALLHTKMLILYVHGKSPKAMTYVSPAYNFLNAYHQCPGITDKSSTYSRLERVFGGIYLTAELPEAVKNKEDARDVFIDCMVAVFSDSYIRNGVPIPRELNVANLTGLVEQQRLLLEAKVKIDMPTAEKLKPRSIYFDLLLQADEYAKHYVVPNFILAKSDKKLIPEHGMKFYSKKSQATGPHKKICDIMKGLQEKIPLTSESSSGSNFPPEPTPQVPPPPEPRQPSPGCTTLDYQKIAIARRIRAKCLSIRSPPKKKRPLKRKHSSASIISPLDRIIPEKRLKTIYKEKMTISTYITPSEVAPPNKSDPKPIVTSPPPPKESSQDRFMKDIVVTLEKCAVIRLDPPSTLEVAQMDVKDIVEISSKFKGILDWLEKKAIIDTATASTLNIIWKAVSDNYGNTLSHMIYMDKQVCKIEKKTKTEYQNPLRKKLAILYDDFSWFDLLHVSKVQIVEKATETLRIIKDHFESSPIDAETLLLDADTFPAVITCQLFLALTKGIGKELKKASTSPDIDLDALYPLLDTVFDEASKLINLS